jgi:hypothetical protein
MPFVTGVVGQFGMKAESTAGTAVTVDKFLPMVSESLNLAINTTQGQGVYGTTDALPLESRWTQTTRTVAGDVEVECSDIGMLNLWRAAMGGSSNSPAVLTGSAYKTVLALGDGTGTGSSLTLQVGRPGLNGTVQPFTVNGAVVTGFEVGGGVTEPVNATFSFDGWNSTTGTALATASYSSGAQQFSGADLYVKIGGTPSTTSGETTVSGGTAISRVTAASVKLATPYYTDAFYANGGGIKARQAVEGYREATFELTVDYDTAQAFYADAVAGTSNVVQVYWQRPTAITGSHYPLLEFTAPSVKWEVPNINVGGPEHLSYTITGKAVRGSGSHNFFQTRIVSTDTAY